MFLGSSSAGHGCFVSSICILPPNKHCEQALIATGATDSTIRLFGLDQAQPVAQLVGHSGNVSALKAGPNGLLISGSWDSTVKQWLKENCVQTMAGKTLWNYLSRAMIAANTFQVTKRPFGMLSWRKAMAKRFRPVLTRPSKPGVPANVCRLFWATATVFVVWPWSIRMSSSLAPTTPQWEGGPSSIAAVSKCFTDIPTSSMPWSSSTGSSSVRAKTGVWKCGAWMVPLIPNSL